MPATVPEPDPITTARELRREAYALSARAVAAAEHARLGRETAAAAAADRAAMRRDRATLRP